MKKSTIKTSLLFTIIALFLCYSCNVFAYGTNPTLQGDTQSGEIQIIGDSLTLTSPTTCTFKYKIMDSKGVDVTSKIIPHDDCQVDASGIVFKGLYSYEGGHEAEAKIDYKTGTCTLLYDFDDSCTVVNVSMVVYGGYYDYGNVHLGYCKDSKYLPIVNPNSKLVDKVWVLSDSLTNTGNDAAIFNYGVFNEAGTNITNDIPASQIEAFSAVYSTTFSATTIDSTTSSATLMDLTTPSATSVDLTTSSATTVDSTTSSATTITTSSATVVYAPVTIDPFSGRGTIKFNVPWSDKITATTLIDKSTGKNMTLNIVGAGGNESQELSATEVHRIDFTSSSLVKTAPDTAKFRYKVSNHYFNNITSEIAESDIDAYAEIGTSKVKVSLDSKNGEGTLKYNFSDADKEALVTITNKTGVTICERLNIVNSESESVDDKNNKDLQIAKIEFLSTGPSIYYHVFNKYGRDITKDIPISQLAVCSSVNCIINLLDLLKMGTYNECLINYNNYDNNRTIILTLMDRLSSVKTSINIGNQPKGIPEDETENAKVNNSVKN